MNGQILLRFEEYRIDPARRELWRHNNLIAVQPKAFDCLAYLIEHRNRVVGSDELIAAVWGRTDLSDNVVMHSIARARHAVGDNGEQQRAIRTVTRVGYAWNLEVDVIATGSAENENGGCGNGQACGDGYNNGQLRESASAVRNNPISSTIESATVGHAQVASLEPTSSGVTATRTEGKPAPTNVVQRARRYRGRYAYGLAAVLLLSVALATFLNRQTGPSTERIEGLTAVVLPVTVVGDTNSSSAWIRLGVMDLIAERLRELGQQVVPSDNTVILARTYIDTKDSGTHHPEPMEAIARTAAAGLVLDVETEAIDGHWRVSLRTVHGRDPPLVAQGEAPDLLIAARAAADRMAVMLGFELVASDSDAQAGSRIDYALQQARAAMLSDHFDAARTLLGSLDDDQHQDPRVGYELAAIDLQRGRMGDAVKSLSRLLNDLPANSSNEFRAKGLYLLGLAQVRLLDYERANQHYEEALGALRGQTSHEARQLTGRVLMSKAGLQSFQNLPEQAEATYARARIALEISGDQLSLAKLDANLSGLYSQIGRSEAITYGERAVQRLAQFGDIQNELRARVYLALAHVRFANASGALSEAQHFSELLARIDNPTLTTAVLVIELGILLTAGRLDAAEGLLIRLGGKTSDSAIEEERVQYFGASLALARKNYERAAELSSSAVQHSWEPAMHGDAAQAWLLLLRAQIGLGQANQASQTLRAAIKWSEGTGNRVDMQTTMALMQAEHAVAVGDVATASASFEEALRLTDQNSLPSEVVRVIGQFVEWLITQGDLERAGVLAGRVSIWSDRSFGAALVQLRLYHAMGEVSGWRLALDRARTLAGEREIDAHLLVPPAPRVATAVQPQ